jgi:DNA replication and repair protein RecF
LDARTATTLTICQIKVKNLRCHEHVIWTCSKGLNLLVGANGSGKTSLLESVYLMVYGRSFRQARDPFLIRRGQERFLIQGQWRRFGPMNLSVAGRRGQISIRLQGCDVQRRKDVSESFPVLVEAPQGRKLIDGAPNERRRWLDALVITCNPAMNDHYERYLRAVMQRSRLLRRRVLSDELDAWEHQIVYYGLPIVAAREKTISEVNNCLINEIFLTEQPLSISLNKTEYTEQAWLERLKSRRIDDMKAGGLRYGPHCDVLKLHFQQREIRNAGSRGQQKLAAIALKMAECAMWSSHRHLVPVLLLDDCLEALDQERQARVLKRLQASPAQILMTAPNGVHISRDVNIKIHSLNAQGLFELDYNSSMNASIMEEAA